MKNGFTIIELTITVMVAAIVLTLGVPTFIESIRTNRLASQTNTLLSALNYARSEAVKLGNSNVTLCRSTDSANCSNGTNWEDGWIIFRDANGNGAVDAGDTLLRVQEPLGGGNTLRLNGFGGSNFVIYRSRGGSAQGTFTLCDSRGAERAKAIVINASGQARAATDDDGDNIVNDHAGDNITCP